MGVNFLKYSIVVLICCCVGFRSFGQAGDVVKRNGQNFLEYKVEKGKTMYSLKREFRITEEELIEHNPQLKDGLKKGDIIYIPMKDKDMVDPDKELNPASKRDLIHTVKKRETVYGIAKKYGITTEKLISVNPDIKEGLKAGDELIIPGQEIDVKVDQDQKGIDPQAVPDTTKDSPHIRYKDSLVLHVVQTGETIYSLSKRYMVSQQDIKNANNGLLKGLRTGDTLRVPVRTETGTMINKEIVKEDRDSLLREALVFKDKYTVAYLLPLFLDKNALKESKRNQNEARELLLQTKIGVDFYAGALLALDSLKKQGVSTEAKFFDTAGDTTKIKTLIASGDLKDVDLIIGPFYNMNVKLMAEYCKENKIHMVIPVASGNKILYKNPYVSKAVTSINTRLETMAEYIVTHYRDANIILIDSKKRREAYMLEVMKSALTEQLSKAFGKPVEPQISYVNSYNANHLKGLISKKEPNVIIALSKDVSYATNFMTQVNSIKNSWDKYSADLTVFVLGEWENFSTIDDLYKNKLKLHYVSNSYIDYDTSTTISFLISYRKEYGYDPSEMGFMGFDLTYNYVATLAKFGSGFNMHLPLLKSNGVHTRFNIRQVQEGSGFENESVYIIRYDGYRLINETWQKGK